MVSGRNRSHGCCAPLTTSRILNDRVNQFHATAALRAVLHRTRCGVPQPSERLFVAEQGPYSGLLLQRCRDRYEQLATCPQPRQADLEVPTDRIKLERRQKPVL